jgi:hypothetical protein
MLSFFLGVPYQDLGLMRLVIIVGSVYGIFVGFLNSLRPLLLPPPPTTSSNDNDKDDDDNNNDKAINAPDNVPLVDA